jgi:diguanylate cyclase (GGDEF)-like protein
MDYKNVLLNLEDRWGLFSFIAITALSLVFTYFVNQHLQFYNNLMRYSAVRYFMLLFYIAVYITCFASFSKIFKFKPFLLGHLFLATGLIYMYLNYRAYAYPDAWYTFSFLKNVKYFTAIKVLVGFMSLNLLVVAISPTSLKYRLTRLIALALLVFVPIFYFIVLYNVSGTAGSSILLYGKGYLTTIYLLNIGIIVATIMASGEENSFGGVVAALAIVNLIMAVNINQEAIAVAKFMFFLEPILVLGGVMFFWFSCLHQRVDYDPLLRIYNRDYAINIIEGKSRVNLGRPFSIAMIDIDRFKKVNDTYGHQIGDEVLHGTAQCIKKYALPKGITCRYGGEEIIVFLRGYNEEDAFVTCEQIRRSVRKIRYIVGRNKDVAVTISIGIAECDEPTVPLERVVEAADKAVYRAKQTGRNRVVKGKIKKRTHKPDRPTYVFMRAPSRDRRQDIQRKKK